MASKFSLSRGFVFCTKPHVDTEGRGRSGLELAGQGAPAAEPAAQPGGQRAAAGAARRGRAGGGAASGGAVPRDGGREGRAGGAPRPPY